jgi:putative endonuclease
MRVTGIRRGSFTALRTTKNMEGKSYFVYIATNKSFTLYAGVTNDISRRMQEHQEKQVNGFTKKYNINKLIYCEIFDNPYEAIQREKQIKGWTRKKKIDLIKSVNSEFKDLSGDL